MLAILEVPLILFCVFVAPIWVILHYRHKNKSTEGGSQEDREKIDELLQLAGRMEQRIQILEEILDKEHPNWRHEI